MVKTTVLYDKDHNPNNEGVNYVAIDVNRIPPYVMETYSTKQEAYCVISASPDSVLIENINFARKLFDFQKEGFDEYEIECQIDDLEKAIRDEEINKKSHSNWALISTLPLVYLFGKEFYDYMAINDPISFDKPVNLIMGMVLGSIFFSSLKYHNKSSSKIEINESKLKDLESKLMNNFLENKGSNQD